MMKTTTLMITIIMAILLSVSVFATVTNAMAIQSAAVHPYNQPSSGDKPVKNNDKATKGDLGLNNHPGPRFHCPPGATPDPSGAKKCVFSNNNDNNKPHNIHSKSYQQGYQMGCTDGPDQENFIGTGGLAHHSKQFVKGYNDAFTHGPCP